MRGKPLMVDLYAGLGGWAEGGLAEGYDVYGFDIEQHIYGHHRYPAQLVVQDVLTLHGRQFKGATVIVASPPCQFFSYCAMPWSKAKALAKQVKADPAPLEKELVLFNACFRIQREASEAAGHHIPIVVENVKGAQPWVGRARWLFGSFALWGDVPALMPITGKRSVMKSGVTHRSDGITNFHGAKVPGFSWSDYGKPDYKPLAFNGEADRRLREDIKNSGGSWFNVAHNTTSGKGQNPDGRKHDGSDWRANGTLVCHPIEWFLMASSSKIRMDTTEIIRMLSGWKAPRTSSGNNSARKMASAMIAKIPETLSRHIARTFYPK
jgi:hypothetical protein